MSANRKLRFQRLPGGDGLTALTSLIEGRDTTFSYRTDEELFSQLRNAFVQFTQSDKKLALVVSSNFREKLKAILSQSDWNPVILSFDQVDRLNELDATLESFQSRSFPDASGSWHRLYNAWDLIDYNEATLKTKALGENDLEHLMAQLALSCAQSESNHLDLFLNPGDYDFNTQEYWSTRGRVHQAASLYRPSYESLKGLPMLHPIFGEMYAPEEARIAIQETTSRLLKETTDLFTALSNWTLRVYKRMASTEQQQCNSLRQGLLDLRQKIYEYNLPDNRSEGGWLSSFSATHRNSDDEDLVAAYQALRKQAQEVGLSNSGYFDEAKNPSEVEQEVSRALSQMNAIKRLIKVYGDGIRQRLNRHTLHGQDLINEYDRIDKSWSTLLEEINGFQLLKEDRVDVSLDIPSQLKLIENLTNDLTQILKEGAHLASYIEWMHFEQSLDPKSRKLISILNNFPQQKWLDIFDAWYARQYILRQDLPTVDTKWVSVNWIALLHHLTSREEDVAIQKMVDRLSSKWKAFARTHKSFAKWLSSGKNYPSLSEELKLSVRSFQITIFTPSEVDEVERWEPDMTLEIDQARLPRKVGPTNRWLKDGDVNRNVFNFFPALHKELLYSDHSKRIDEIKVLADHLVASYAPFEVWQHKHEAFLVFCSKEVKRVLWKNLEGDLQRIHINGRAHTDALVETFINNRERRFYGLFSANSESAYPTNDITMLWDGLANVGVENHYLCWSELLQQSLLLQKGRHQRHDRNHPPFRTHPVVKGY